jgi:hypothetical protein
MTSSDPTKIYEINTDRGRFRYCADTPGLADDHRNQLAAEDNFPEVLSGPKYIGATSKYLAGWVWEGMGNPMKQATDNTQERGHTMSEQETPEFTVYNYAGGDDRQTREIATAGNVVFAQAENAFAWIEAARNSRELPEGTYVVEDSDGFPVSMSGERLFVTPFQSR